MFYNGLPWSVIIQQPTYLLFLNFFEFIISWPLNISCLYIQFEVLPAEVYRRFKSI